MNFIDSFRFSFKLLLTGQVKAAFSSLRLVFLSKFSLNRMLILISFIRLGFAPIIFSISAVVPLILRWFLFATIPIIVNMQEASAVATRSVGENASPFPWLSIGASVMIVLPDCT